MKYFPLVWAALTRKKLRALLILFSVTAAFILFGLSIGFDASMKRLADLARADRIVVQSRFGAPMPLGTADKIARLPGVKVVSPQGAVGGYYRTPRNNTFVMMVAPNFLQVFPELPVTPAQLAQLKTYPDGAFYSKLMAQRWHLKVGDRFPIQSPGAPRADGTRVWTFQVLGIVDDLPAEFPAGFAIGSLDYFEHARAVANQNTIGAFRVISNNPQMGEATAKLIDANFANSSFPTWSMTEKFGATNGFAAAGINIDFLTRSVAGAGLFMILFLTANAIAQSVRERIPEFAVLKTIGFSDAGVMALVAAESAIPCLLGAGLGMLIAKWFAATLPKLLPPNVGLPLPYLSPFVFALAFGSAFLVAALSSVIPAMRLKRLDVATALSGRT